MSKGLETYCAEQISNVVLIGCRGKVGHKQSRLGTEVNLDSVAIEGLLVTSLCSGCIVSGIELDHGHFRVSVFTRHHLDTINSTALFEVS